MDRSISTHNHSYRTHIRDGRNMPVDMVDVHIADILLKISAEGEKNTDIGGN